MEKTALSHHILVALLTLSMEEEGEVVVVDVEMLEEDSGEVKMVEEVVEVGGREMLSRMGSLHKEANNKVAGLPTAANLQVLPTATVLQLAFQSIGVVYGDIGTSPLYVFSSTFQDRIPTQHEILGALSLIIYSLTLFPLIKYALIVLWANDNGDGGTFALYSLICRHSNVNVIPNQQLETTELSAYNLRLPERCLERARRIKEALEGSECAKSFLLWMALLGTCMVIGDGILTPCISVLSAVGGVQKISASIRKDETVMISVAILVVLFSIQRFGTDKVGYSFAPILLIWFAFTGIIGILNMIRHDQTVLKAFNPVYIFLYFSKDPKQAWISLGGTVLCMTGTEAMFADLGHFSVRSIQISFTGIVYPCVLCAYIGQAAYLSNFPGDVSDPFYKSIPESVYWPMFITAILASIIASQAMISATFSIVKQSMALGCFPRVRVNHTSTKHEGQVYIPEINFLLMFACITVTCSFKETTKIGNAYGITVVAVMVVTSFFLTLIMIMIWGTNLILVSLFVLVYGSIEILYFSSVLSKFTKGGYLPLSFSIVLFSVMYIWHYVQSKRHAFEVENKVSTHYLNNICSDSGIMRVPGVGLLYTELTHGIPAIFPHFLTNLPAIHSVLLFVSIKHLPINKVLMCERLLIRRVGHKNYKMYSCIARYGYRDMRIGNEQFEALLMEHLKYFIKSENRDQEDEESQTLEAEDEITFLEKSRDVGVVYLLGHSEVKAGNDSSFLKRVAVNYIYDFLRRNFRQGFVDLQVPNKNLLQVGMNYYI